MSSWLKLLQQQENRCLYRFIWTLLGELRDVEPDSADWLGFGKSTQSTLLSKCMLQSQLRLFSASQSSCFSGEHLRSSSSIPRVVTQGDFVSKFWPGWNEKMHSVEWVGERVSSFLLVTTSFPLRNMDYRASWLLQLLMLCIFFSTPKFPCLYSWFAS